MSLTVVYKEPGKDPEVREIGDSDRASARDLHELVKGYIELISIHELQIYKLDMWGNEDARRLELLPNIYHHELAYDGLVLGPVVIASHQGAATIGLKDFQVQIAKRWLIDNAVDPNQFHLMGEGR